MEMPGKMEMLYSIGLNRPRGAGSLPIIPGSKYRLLRISHPEKLVRGNLPIAADFRKSKTSIRKYPTDHLSLHK